MTYCRGYSGGIADVWKRGQVPDRCRVQFFLPHLSPVTPHQSLHLSAVAPPLPGQPRPRPSPSAQGVRVLGCPSRRNLWSARLHAAQNSGDYKLAARCSPFWKEAGKRSFKLRRVRCSKSSLNSEWIHSGPTYFCMRLFSWSCRLVSLTICLMCCLRSFTCSSNLWQCSSFSNT